MMKKQIWILCTLLAVLLTLAVAADGVYVIDNAGLLSDDARERLEDAAENASAEMGVDFVILTEYGIGGEDPYMYAADFYDYGGYAMDGVILFLDMEERNWCIITSGSCISGVDNTEIDRIGDVMVPYLSSGDYETGFSVFLEETAYWMTEVVWADDGYTDDDYFYDDEYYDPPRVEYQKTVSVPQCIAVGGVIGLIVALIVCFTMRSKMNTAKPQFAAGFYMVDNSFELLHSRDRFLYSNVSKVARPKENHSGGSRSGGGSFRGSSGRSHGGGGGRF